MLDLMMIIGVGTVCYMHSPLIYWICLFENYFVVVSLLLIWFGFNGFGFVVEYFDFNCFVVIDFDLIVVVMNLIGIDFVVI